jgi:enoyl-CoA hydratase
LLCNTPFTADAKQTVTDTLQKFCAPAVYTPLSFHAYEPELTRIFAASTMEEIVAELMTHSATDAFYLDVLRTVLQKSPSSLKVTLAALRRGQHRTFDECMAQEFILVQHFLMHGDFFEGIRALLIDKDQTPHWRPATLAAVNDAEVARYFVPAAAYGTCKI